MSDLRDAAEKALKALEGWKDDAPSWWTTGDEKTITALKAALEQSKPVEVMDAPLLLNGQPLYTHPPIERTLTDEKIAELWHQNGGFHHHFARAVERYLKGEK